MKNEVILLNTSFSFFKISGYITISTKIFYSLQKQKSKNNLIQHIKSCLNDYSEASFQSHLHPFFFFLHNR